MEGGGKKGCGDADMKKEEYLIVVTHPKKGKRKKKLSRLTSPKATTHNSFSFQCREGGGGGRKGKLS